jgi:hypothetical protein
MVVPSSVGDRPFRTRAPSPMDEAGFGCRIMVSALTHSYFLALLIQGTCGRFSTLVLGLRDDT